MKSDPEFPLSPGSSTLGASWTEAGALILIKAATPLRPLDFSKVSVQRPGEQAGHPDQCCPVLDEFRKAVAMAKGSFGLAMLVLAVAVGLATPSHAQAPGTVNVVFAKAGLIVGAGGGRGVLTYRGRDYPFRVSGLSLGITIGASAMRLTGRVSGLRELRDFSGIYDAVGAGGALVGGFGGVQLTNKKGVMITLQGLEAGLEFAANRSGIRISLQ
jgi:hypothetical protein